MASREEIERILRTELDRAVLCVHDVRIQYRKILDELAHGSPSSKDIDRLEEAAEIELAARSAMWTALVRFSDFLKKGTIPDNLQENCETGHSATSRKRGLASHG